MPKREAAGRAPEPENAPAQEAETKQGKERKPRQKSLEQVRVEARRMSGLALETLQQILAGDAQDSVKLAAARDVLDRGYGKPKAGEPLGEAAGGGFTVIVKRYTDAPDSEAGKFEEIP